MEENNGVKVEGQTVGEQQVGETGDPKGELPAVTIQDNWLDKLQQKNYKWRLERAQKKAAKKPLTKAEKGARIGIGVGIGLAALGATAGVVLRQILNSASSDYELGDGEIAEEDEGYFSSQLNGATAEATEEEV